jgi:hypothetical protein
MKCVFCDFDGVINNYHLDTPWTRPDGTVQQPSKGTTNTFEGTVGFDYDKVERLNRIFDNSDWSIVISSSWGLSQRTRLALIKFGFKHCHRIVGELRGPMSGRGALILHYVDCHSKITDFITIEDEDHDIIGSHESVTDDIRKKFFR